MSEYASQVASLHAGMIGLMFFFIFFVGAALWTFRPGAKDKYLQDATIPLRNDNDE